MTPQIGPARGPPGVQAWTAPSKAPMAFTRARRAVSTACVGIPRRPGGVSRGVPLSLIHISEPTRLALI
eukprot:4565456-Alexandrium_andersonii.AAC.1